MKTFRVLTPENVEFEYALAGLGRRLVSWLIDLLLIWAVLFLTFLLVTFTPGGMFVGGIVMMLTIFALNVGYFATLEWAWNGKTIGKAVVGIRVIQESGVRITAPQAMVRNFLRFVDMQPGAPLLAGYIVGAGASLLHPLGKRLGDMAAGTVVVRETRAVMPARIITPRDRFNTIQDDPAARRRIRERITPRERDLAIRLCLRREQLDSDVRLRLFETFGDHLRRRLALEGFEFLAGERLVQNVAAILVAPADQGL